MRLAGAISAVIALAACTPTASDTESPTEAGTTTATVESTPTPEPSPGLAAVANDEQAGLEGRLLQFRRDVAFRRVEVRLTAANDGLIVEALELRAPGLTPGPGSPRATPLLVGQPRDYKVVLGAADCGVVPGPPVAEVSLRDDAGDRRTVEVPLDDDDLVQRLYAADCAEQSLLAQVDIRVAAVEPVTTAAGPALRVEIDMSRVAGADPVRVTGIGSNTVYDISAVGALPTLGESGSVTLRVDMLPARCDSHGLGESYRTSLIGLLVALGDGEPRLFVLTPEPDVRRQLETFAVDTCRSTDD